MTIQKLKEKVREYEYFLNGFQRLNGAYVKVVNIKKKRDRLLADVILYNGEHEERYNKCNYPLIWFGG